MSTITFKAKIQHADGYRDIVDGKLTPPATFDYVKIPKITSSHFNKRAFERHPHLRMYTNSDIFPAMLTKEMHKLGIKDMIRFDKHPKNVSIQRKGPLAEVTITLDNMDTAASTGGREERKMKISKEDREALKKECDRVLNRIRCSDVNIETELRNTSPLKKAHTDEAGRGGRGGAGIGAGGGVGRVGITSGPNRVLRSDPDNYDRQGYGLHGDEIVNTGPLWKTTTAKHPLYKVVKSDDPKAPWAVVMTNRKGRVVTLDTFKTKAGADGACKRYNLHTPIDYNPETGKWASLDEAVEQLSFENGLRKLGYRKTRPYGECKRTYRNEKDLDTASVEDMNEYLKSHGYLQPSAAKQLWLKDDDDEKEVIILQKNPKGHMLLRR